MFLNQPKQNRSWMIVTTNQRRGGKSTEIYPTFNLWRMTGGWFLIWHTPVDYFKLTPHVVVFGKNGEKPGSPNWPQHFRSLPILNHNKRYQNMWPVKNTPVSHMASHTSPFSPGIFFSVCEFLLNGFSSFFVLHDFNDNACGYVNICAYMYTCVYVHD